MFHRRLFASIVTQSKKHLFEREIRSSLAKLERLTALLPQDDQRKQRALDDIRMINTDFGSLMMIDGSFDTDLQHQA
jgi:hypothetical protein